MKIPRNGSVSRPRPGGTVLALLLLAGCRTRFSTEDEPAEPPVRIHDARLEASMLYRSEERERKSGSLGDESWQQQIYRETLSAAADGYIYHPYLLDFSVASAIGLTQSEFQQTRGSSEQESSDSGTLREYDVTGRVLKNSNLPLTAYSRRHESLEARPFLNAEFRTIQEDGFFWQYLSDVVPTSLRYDHSEIAFDPLGPDFTGPSALDDQSRSKTTDQVQFDTEYRFSKNNKLSLDYEHSSVREHPFDVHYEVDSVRVAHDVRFGAEDQHDLLSEVVHYDQRGTVELQQFLVRELLGLEHSDTLRSRYHLDAASRSQRGISGNTIEDDTLGFGADLEHRLYESLFTRVGGWADTQQFDDGAATDRYGVRGNFDYQKKNPWGLFNANYGADYQSTRRTSGDQRVAVIDQSRTFNDPNPIILSDNRIVTSSIVITDTTALNFYEEDVDYDVVKFANRIELHRIPTGDILDGQTVLIDYEIDNSSDYTLASTYQTFGLRQNFAFGLSPYYRYEWQDQTISGQNVGTTQQDDIRAHTAGVEYRRGAFHALAEYEDHDSTIAPFQAFTLSGDYSHRFEYGATAGVNSRYTDVSFTGDRPREASYFTLGVRYFDALTPKLTFEGSAQYLMDQDSVSNNNQGVDVDLSLNWKLRRTNLSINFSNGRFQNDFTESRSTMLYMKWELRF